MINNNYNKIKILIFNKSKDQMKMMKKMINHFYIILAIKIFNIKGLYQYIKIKKIK